MAYHSSPPRPSPPPPPPSHLDAITLPTSLTPALIPSPAATTPSPQPASRSPQNTAAGRNKSQRWSRDTPPSGKSGGGVSPISFKEALLSKLPAAPTSPSALPLESLPRTVPRILLRVADSRPPPAERGPDAEGWQEAESRRSRKARRRAERGPRRHVPADLRGLCFNCFAPEHRAAICTNRTRCFKCRRPGHRAFWCPNSGMSARPQPPAQPLATCGLRKMVWRRKDVGPTAARGSDGMGGVAASIPPPADGVVANGPTPADVGGAGGGAHEGGGRRRRRRVRRRRATEPADEVLPPPAVANLADVTAVAGGTVPHPRCIIDRSEKIARAEEDLRCALSVLVVGDPRAVSVDGLAAELSRRYDLPAGSLALHRMSPNELLLVFSNEADAVRVYDNERPIHLPQVTLHCRRWTRLRNATSFTLPHLVDIEVRGVPPHVWELETAEHLLDDWCWVRALHPDTLERKDYSSFRLSAWCSCPDEVPEAMDLIVVEPPAPVEEHPPVKRALSYSVNIAVEPYLVRPSGPDAPPATHQNAHGGRRRRRRDSRSPDVASRSSTEEFPSRDDAPRSLNHGDCNHLGGGAGTQGARLVDSCSASKKAAAATDSSRRVLPAAMNCIDDMAALVILPAVSRMGDEVPEIQEEEMRCLAFDEAFIQRANPAPKYSGPVLTGPAHVSENNSRISVTIAPPLTSLEKWSEETPPPPALQKAQLQQATVQTIDTEAPSGKNPLSTCVVDASGAPLPELGPACADVASTPPPGEPLVVEDANFSPTGVVEDNLAPLPASPWPACVEATYVPPLVTILEDQTDGDGFPTNALPVEQTILERAAESQSGDNLSLDVNPESFLSMVSPTLVCFEMPSPARHERMSGVQVETLSSVPDDSPERSLQPLCRKEGPPSNVQEQKDKLMKQQELMNLSPVSWRPAQEVLPMDFSSKAITEIHSREVNFVYCRRPRASVQQISQPSDPPPKTPDHPPATSTFIESVTRPLDIALPLPSVKQQRRRNVVGTEPPRRSCRIANLPPENKNPSATTVCRQLGFTEENSKVSAAMLEKYQVFFNSPLKRNDVKVLAAMMRKELPEEFQMRSPEVLVVA
ncbi:unnamed protein product [Urochloa humidicola]